MVSDAVRKGLPPVSRQVAFTGDGLKVNAIYNVRIGTLFTDVVEDLDGYYAAEKMNLYGDKITPIRKAFLHFKFAVVYIGHGDFNSALKFVNEILNSPEIDKSEDIIGFTQLLDLLIHIELRHNKLLPYTLKNAQRFFKTRNRLYHFEKIFLQFIAKLIKCDDYFDLQTLWENLNNELSSISNDDIFESIALEYFDFQVINMQ